MIKAKLKILIFAVLVALLLCLAGCNTKVGEKSHTAEIFALDTVISLTAYGENAEASVSAATQEIYRLDNLLSVTNSASDIYKLNNAKGEAVTVSSETYALLKTSKEVSLSTKGNFDVTIYPVMKLWGFTEDTQKVPAKDELSKALAKVYSENIILSENNTVKLINNAMCDLGGIAKGYIADKAAAAMTNAGADYGIISLGGNVRTIGSKPDGEKWSVGIKDPAGDGYFATLFTDECSVITSGAYQRNFTEDEVVYHHIIDPTTGYPSKSDAVSVTIIGKDGAICDALSTAIYIGGSEYAAEIHRQHKDFEYVILTKDKEVIASKGLSGNIKLTENDDITNITYK